MDWESDDRIEDEIWPDAISELATLDQPKVLGLYRAAGRQKILAVVDVVSTSELSLFSSLAVLKNPTIEKTWALRDYIGFAEDVKKGYRFD